MDASHSFVVADGRSNFLEARQVHEMGKRAIPAATCGAQLAAGRLWGMAQRSINPCGRRIWSPPRAGTRAGTQGKSDGGNILHREVKPYTSNSI